MRLILLFFTLFLLPRSAVADIRLAVLEFRGVGISESLLYVLTDKVREGVLHTSKGHKIRGENLIIMTRENMMEILKDQDLSAEDCHGACEVEIAKNIGADYVISGNLTKIDDLYILAIKLHETVQSNLLSSESFESEKERELFSNAEQLGGQVFLMGLDLASESQKHNVNYPPKSHFGGGVRTDMAQKLKEKDCRRFAEEEGQRLHEEMIRKEIQNLKLEATQAWEAMTANLHVCLQLDLEERDPCIKALDEWLEGASELQLVLPSGVEKVQTECGIIEEPFLAVTREVNVEEYVQALEMKKKMKIPSIKKNLQSKIQQADQYYYGDDGFKKDIQKAQTLYEESCSLGSVRACMEYAFLLYTGKGGTEDKPKAIRLLSSDSIAKANKECLNGAPRTCVRLGTLYYFAIGVRQSATKAAELFSSSCDGDLAFGCSNLAFLYKVGHGVDTSPEKSAYFYRKACSLGDSTACK